MAPRLPAVSAYWRYFSLCQMGLYFSHRAHPERQLVCATGESESEEVWEGEQGQGKLSASLAATHVCGIARCACPSCCSGTAAPPLSVLWSPQTLYEPPGACMRLPAGHRSRDFTDGLRRYESQRHTLKGFLAWLRRWARGAC